MKNFLLSLTLMLVTFQGSKAANVTSCLRCNGNGNGNGNGNDTCVEGTGKGNTCTF